MLFTPTVVLGLRGMERVLDAVPTPIPTAAPAGATGRRSLGALLPVVLPVLLVAPALAVQAPAFVDQLREFKKLVSHEPYAVPEFAFYHGSFVDRYQQRASQDYRTFLPLVQFLREPGSLPGPIYVFGNPLITLLSGREDIMPIHGWSWEVFPEPLWQELPSDLEHYRPVYVFFQEQAADLVGRRSPETMAVIARHYVIDHDTPLGRWYRLVG